MKVIRQSGNWYLVDLGDGRGRVLDLDFHRFFPAMSMVSLLAKGGWEPFSGDEAAVLEHAEQAEDLGSASPAHAGV
jgi:hypothetical protein